MIGRSALRRATSAKPPRGNADAYPANAPAPSTEARARPEVHDAVPEVLELPGHETRCYDRFVRLYAARPPSPPLATLVEYVWASQGAPALAKERIVPTGTPWDS